MVYVLLVVIAILVLLYLIKYQEVRLHMLKTYVHNKYNIQIDEEKLNAAVQKIMSRKKANLAEVLQTSLERH